MNIIKTLEQEQLRRICRTPENRRIVKLGNQEIRPLDRCGDSISETYGSKISMEKLIHQ